MKPKQYITALAIGLMAFTSFGQDTANQFKPDTISFNAKTHYYSVTLANGRELTTSKTVFILPHRMEIVLTSNYHYSPNFFMVESHCLKKKPEGVDTIAPNYNSYRIQTTNGEYRTPYPVLHDTNRNVYIIQSGSYLHEYVEKEILAIDATVFIR